ncbi:MAG: hypothetical protein KGP13_03985 [Burkholderiales bacterium]|jgi:hypothetical protein|nr:hypothetical protein [Burkholderiales bacterium]
MARKSKVARSRQRSNIFFGSMALLLVIFVMGTAAWWWNQKRNAIDPKTLCPLHGPLGHNILLVDKTDPLNLAQKAAFDLLVTDLVSNKTPPGFLLSIFVLGDNFVAQNKPLVELCNPGDGKGHNELTENIKQLNRMYKDRFLNPIFEQSTQLLSIAPAQESPILEMLQMVSLNAIQKHHVDGPKTLIILSDLLQNSKQLNMYKGLPNFAQFTNTPYAQKTKIHFQEVDIQIHYLQNSPQLQGEGLFLFWREYFKAAGSKSVALVALPG